MRPMDRRFVAYNHRPFAARPWTCAAVVPIVFALFTYMDVVDWLLCKGGWGFSLPTEGDVFMFCVRAVVNFAESR